MYRTLPSLVKLKAFYSLHAIANEIVFLISFSVCSLLVCRNTTNLYPATSLNLFINLNSVYVCVYNLKGFLLVKWHYLQIGISLLLHFQFECALFLFLVTENSSATLHRSDESRHLCLHSDLAGKFFQLFSSSTMLTVDFSYVFFYYYFEVISFNSQFVDCFYHEIMLNSMKCFFCISWDHHIALLFFLLTCPIILIDFSTLKHPCILGLNPTWPWCVIYLMCFWIEFASIFFFWEFLYQYLSGTLGWLWFYFLAVYLSDFYIREMLPP